MSLKGPLMIPDWIISVLLLIVGVIGSGTIYYYLSQKRPVAALWAGFVGGTLLLLCVALYLHNAIAEKRRRAESPIFHGQIVAANEPTPHVPPDTFSLMLGDDLQVLTKSSEQFIFSKDGKPFLKLRISGVALYITASVVDRDGRNIVRIIDNEFQASQENAFNPKQPDPNTLIVRDLEGVEVLNVRYLNPRVIRLVGRFHMPGSTEPVEVLPVEGVRWPGGGGIGHMTVDMTQASAGFIAF